MHWAEIWNATLNWVAHHPAVAYPAIFLIAFSESLALVGLLVPGTALMIGIGAFVGNGALSLPTTLSVAILGAIAGDGISFWLGKHYHRDITHFWPFNKYSGLLVSGESFFHRHGGKSVFLGRFVGPVRPIIPVVAGMLDMPLSNFLWVNILSAVGWAFAYIMPGVLLGSSLALVGAVSMRLSLFVLLLLLLIWSVFALSRKVFTWLGKLGPRGERLLLPLLCLSLVLAGWLFLGVLEDVVNMDPLVQADQSIYRFLQSLRTPWGDRIMVAMTELGDSLPNAAILATALLYFLLKRRYRIALYWCAAASGAGGLVQLFMWLLHRPRPIDIYQGLSAWSFPSGHTTMSVVIYSFLAVLLVRSFTAKWRWLPFAGAVGLPLLIAFSRLYLGAHWFSDVLGGLALGWAWAIFLGIFYLRRSEPPLPRTPIVAGFLCALLVVGGWHIQRRHTTDLARYQPQEQIQSFSLNDWQTQAWQKLPGWRIDFEGEQEQPLTLQWAGDPQMLSQQLQKQGWAVSSQLRFKQLLNFFIPHVELQQFPVLPQLAEGRQERLIMVRYRDDHRLLLRLWPSRFELRDANLPLWVGSLTCERVFSAAGLISLPVADRQDLPTMEELKGNLSPFSSLRVERSTSVGTAPEPHNAQVLLLWEKS
ncbi:MAG: phosphatase PAP2 family protein [Desulfuromonadales bacterium]|nr:phosphatase PAP2 family protein [Desulfuromonadales bacterium]MBN2791798.1 phosphatase PAP2 family protein [Desulfuromonadales bacterium]